MTITLIITRNNNNNNKSEAICVTGHGGPEACEMSRLPYFLDNRLTDGCEVVSLTCQPPFTLRKIPGNDFR
jgi:hypothetical protein